MFAITLSCLLLLLTVLYLYLKSAYFTLRGPIPGIPPQFFFGNLIQSGLLSWKPVSIPDHFVQLTRQLGDVFQFWSGSTRIIVPSRLEDVQHVFAHRHASVCSPLFRRGKVLMYLHTITDCTDRLLDRWRIHFNDPKQSQVIHPSPEPAGTTSFLAVSLPPDSCPEKTGELLSVPIGARKVRLETDWKISGIVRKHPTGIRRQRTSQKRLGNGRKRRKPAGSDTEIAGTGRLSEVPATGLIDLGKFIRIWSNSRNSCYWESLVTSLLITTCKL